MLRTLGIRIGIPVCVWLVSGAALAQSGSPAAAAPSGELRTPELRASRASGPVRVDGRLDDPAWSTAEVAGSFVQRAPDSGAPASQRTEVRVLYDEAALYVAARMFDSSPDSIAAPLIRRDGTVYSDWFDVLVDSYNDQRTGFRFFVNPRGVKRDILLSNDANEDVSWDAVWEVETTIDSSGWTAEFRIPFTQLRFGRAAASGVRVWGINFTRVVARRDETSNWSPVPVNYQGLVSRAGRLSGLTGIGTPRRLEVQPYTSARLTREPGALEDPYYDSNRFNGSVGADIKAGITSGITLTATINPDFGQVEVDPAVVNLSAFETLLPENRPFFVEGVDIFRFGSLLGFISPGPAPYFYTRRVGRPPQRSVSSVPDLAFYDAPNQSTILGAAKISGRAGGWSLGVLDAVTGKEEARYTNTAGERGSTPTEPLTNYFVGRIRRDFNRGSTVIGGIATATNRDMGDEVFDPILRSSAYVGGIDAEHSWKNRTYSISGYFAGSAINGSRAAISRTQLSSARYFLRPDATHLEYDSTRTSFQGYAGAVAFRKAGDWRGSVFYQEISPGFETNDVGYQTRADLRNLTFLYGYRRSKPGKLLRDYFIRAFGTNQWNFGGDRTFNSSSLRGTATLNNLWNGQATVTYAPRAWNDRLTRGGPLVRYTSSYGADIWIGSDVRKKINGNGTAYYQRDELGAWGWGISFGLNARPASNFRIGLNPTVDLAHDLYQYITARADPLATETLGRRYVFATVDQATVSMGTRVEWTFTPALSLQLYAQPFVSAADYSEYKEFARARTFDFEVYGSDRGTIQRNPNGTFTADPDGAGPARPLTFGQAADAPVNQQGDFRIRSLRGNAVLRWEYRPGSTVFFVWQQERAGERLFGDLDAGRDFGGLLDEPARNVFLVKATYWLSR